ncbi:acyl-CoA thioesterase [Pelobacter seleniigenes]|uniref:acyl-CoA thioesterase n=1 Tax=Pelobacter seleniigenes TaxID=407188 RepID=UPI0004A6B561|nr:hotdog domain-containing protein [Pelobacter seleniigenes]
MDNFTIVRPEHLNHHGYLFGGVMLKWVDENAWMAASRDFPGRNMVTVGMDACRFRQRVENGSILRFHMSKVRQGTTSVTYNVDVFADAPGAASEYEVFNVTVSFVGLDDKGKPVALADQP